MRNFLIPLLVAGCSAEKNIVYLDELQEEEGPQASDAWSESEDPGHPGEAESEPRTYERFGDWTVCQHLAEEIGSVRSDIELTLMSTSWLQEDEDLWVNFEVTGADADVTFYPCTEIYTHYFDDWDYQGWTDSKLFYANGDGDEWFDSPKIDLLFHTPIDPHEVAFVTSHYFLIEDSVGGELKWLADAETGERKNWLCLVESDDPRCS